MVAPTRNDESKIAKAPPKPVAKDERKSEHAKPAENSSAETGRRENLRRRERRHSRLDRAKLKVPYDDLMAANHIDDPHKLQIGQKLIIPTKPTKPKKGD